MANQKLTDLTQATTPLSGTEQVYVVQGGNSRRATAQQLADVPGEWSADTVTQAEAEAGTATTRRAWTALRVAQAVAAWWAGSAAKTKLDGIASGATANATDAQLRDRSTHTGTQAASTITGLATVATSGAYADLSGLPTLGTAAATDASAYATAAQGAKADSAVQPATLSAYVQTSDVRLTDSREWSAATIDQAEAEAGTATTRRAFTAQRVFQAIAAWWAASSAKTKLDGVATGATANQTDAYLLSRANHTGTQAAGTITGLATVATSGSASDLETGTLPAARLPATTVSAGSYTNASITVGADGRITAASTGAASAAYRSSSSVTTSSIAQGASGTATIALPRSCIATSITSDKAGWLRLYNSAAAATGDANRSRATDPTAGSGVLLEVIFAATGTITLSPPASVLNAESTPDTTYTIAFANDGTTGTATLTINYLLLEV